MSTFSITSNLIRWLFDFFLYRFFYSMFLHISSAFPWFILILLSYHGIRQTFINRILITWLCIVFALILTWFYWRVFMLILIQIRLIGMFERGSSTMIKILRILIIIFIITNVFLMKGILFKNVIINNRFFDICWFISMNRIFRVLLIPHLRLLSDLFFLFIHLILFRLVWSIALFIFRLYKIDSYILLMSWKSFFQIAIWFLF